jgi:hypothetical protein
LRPRDPGPCPRYDLQALALRKTLPEQGIIAFINAYLFSVYHEYTAALRGAALCHHREARAKPITEKLRTNEAKLFYFEYFLEHALCCKDSADYQIESRAAKATLGKN